jgi:hypothetical protein
MKKLSLMLDDVRVDSFHTSGGQREEGTVFGEECTCQTNCTCPGCPTCAATCPYTCENTCYQTCGGQETCGYQLNPPDGPFYPCWYP